MNDITPRERIEREILGCVILEPSYIPQVAPEWFDDLRLGVMLQIIQKMARDGEEIHFGSLYYKAPTPENFGLIGEARDYCDTPAVFPALRKEWLQMVKAGRALQALQEIEGSRGTPGFSLHNAVKKLEAAAKLDEDVINHSYSPNRIASNLLDAVEARYNLNGAKSGLETGFIDFDRFTDGLQRGENSILAARPSVGKTALAVNIVNRICLVDKIPSLFISLEMSAGALSQRMLACNQRLDMRTLRTGKLTPMDFSKTSTFNAILKKSPLYIEEHLSGASASHVASLMRSYAKKFGVKLVVIDYLQKIKADTKNEKRTYEVAETSGILTGAAKESGVAMLCLAQLNREGEKQKGKDNVARRPRLSDLSDSGQIERDADNVFMLHRPNLYSTEVIIGKQRDGETGLFSLNFQGEFCLFENATHEDGSNI